MCRLSLIMDHRFQSLPGNSKIVGQQILFYLLNKVELFQSLPGNSKIVGEEEKPINDDTLVKVSIPSREF
ncbi:hypothetical protein MHK_005363 [Candidatus Magnetomorum sp. HK-1]|nr:hypothetical protein MHK_005362 [Candidatus Magnetomorum sp. HK-1]KPA14440.1 hypothetical protein MHK_005363 [Candidatus Magnetomorum sp. HK-1]